MAPNFILIFLVLVCFGSDVVHSTEGKGIVDQIIEELCGEDDVMKNEVAKCSACIVRMAKNVYEGCASPGSCEEKEEDIKMGIDEFCKIRKINWKELIEAIKRDEDKILQVAKRLSKEEEKEIEEQCKGLEEIVYEKGWSKQLTLLFYNPK